MKSSLSIDNISSGYGNKKVLDGASVHAQKGEIIALIGHNGAGKSTLLKSIFGTVRIWGGEIIVDEKHYQNVCPRIMRDMGVCYVPQGNCVFTDLSVRENLDVALSSIDLSRKSKKQKVTELLDFFPSLEKKLTTRAGLLSGGERQMLSLANAFMLSPDLVLLDEPSLGLSPMLVTETFGRIREINRSFGTAFIIVEHKVNEVLKIANRVYVLRNGRVSFTGPSDSLADHDKLRSVYL